VLVSKINRFKKEGKKNRRLQKKAEKRRYGMRRGARKQSYRVNDPTRRRLKIRERLGRFCGVGGCSAERRDGSWPGRPGFGFSTAVDKRQKQVGRKARSIGEPQHISQSMRALEGSQRRQA